jgi:integrase/recombinase XerD
MKLSQAIGIYIQRKQDAGMRFETPVPILRSFSRHCGDIHLRHITASQVAVFLDSSRVRPNTWKGRRGTLRSFFDYWTARGRLKSSPLLPSGPKTDQSFVPYIYSQSDLRLLLCTVPRCQRHGSCAMSGATFRTLLLFLYATGMRLGEALRLRLSDLDLAIGLVTIKATKFYKTRLVPLGSDLQKLIREYLQVPEQRQQKNRYLFQTQSGNPLSFVTVDKSFQRLRRIAGVERRDKSSYQPRLHDLRHTFAVHRLTEWYRQNADLQRLLPALSTYLGHVNLIATQRYLTMTPELLQQANHRFERYVYRGAYEK